MHAYQPTRTPAGGRAVRTAASVFKSGQDSSSINASEARKDSVKLVKLAKLG